MSKDQKKANEQARKPRARKMRLPKPQLFDWSKYDPATTPHIGVNVLEAEAITYRDHLPELLKDEGKFVLIKGREVIGIYESWEEAIQQAVDRFRDAPVFIKQIAQKEPVQYLGGAAF